MEKKLHLRTRQFNRNSLLPKQIINAAIFKKQKQNNKKEHTKKTKKHHIFFLKKGRPNMFNFKI